MQVGILPADLKLRIIQVVYLLCESIKVNNICSRGIICVVPHTEIPDESFALLRHNSTHSSHESASERPTNKHPVSFNIFILRKILIYF
jgi:hypothetical protein